MSDRDYNNKLIKEDEDYIVPLSENDTTKSIRDEYYYHNDDSCFWAKNIDGVIYYSNDDIFDTEKEDSTNIVIFMK